MTPAAARALAELPNWILGQMLWTWQDRQLLQKRDTDLTAFLAEMHFAASAPLWDNAPILRTLRVALAEAENDES